MFRFASALRLTGLIMAALLAWTCAVLAQQAPLVGIDPIRASLEQIETAAKRSRLGVRTLSDLAQRISPLRDQMRDKLADLEPRLADLDARLKGLGPAPAKDVPEDAGIAAERARLTQQRAEMDAAIKQVQLLQTRADQLANALSDRRRSAYAETLFRRSPNVLDPYFWRDVVAAAPDYGGRIARFAQDWAAYAREKGGSVRMASAGLALAGLIVLAFGLVRWWRRISVVSRVGGRYGKALAALVVFVRRALAMPLAVFVVLELLDQFDLIPPDAARLTTNLIIGTAIAALARAAATSVLAPDDPARRLVNFDDATAQWLFSHLTWGGRLFGAFIMLRALHRTIGVPQVMDDATRMLFAAIIAALLVHLLIARREVDEEEASGRHIPGVRLLAWIAVACILGALLAGYASFASFLAGRVVFTIALIATLDGVRVHLESGAQRAGRDVLDVFGLRDEEAGGGRLVRVGLEEGGAARAERAILVELDRSDPEHAVVEPALRPATERGLDRRGVVAQHRIEPDVERVLLAEFLVELGDQDRGAGIVHAGHPPAVHLGDRGLDGVLHLCARRRRDRALDEALRVVDEDTGRIPLRVLDDLAATRARRRAGDVRLLEGERVHEAGVAIDALEVHRMIGHRAGQRLVRRPAGVAPVVLVPAAADDPLAARRRAGALDDTGDHLVVRGGAGEIHVPQRHAEPGDMGVRVGHPRDHRAALQVDDLRVRTGQCAGAKTITGEDDASAAHGERIHDRTRAIGRVDAAVGDDDVGGGGRRRLADGDDGERERDCDGQCAHERNEAIS